MELKDQENENNDPTYVTLPVKEKGRRLPLTGTKEQNENFEKLYSELIQKCAKVGRGAEKREVMCGEAFQELSHLENVRQQDLMDPKHEFHFLTFLMDQDYKKLTEKVP